MHARLANALDWFRAGDLATTVPQSANDLVRVALKPTYADIASDEASIL
jgi:hypothetical protein